MKMLAKLFLMVLMLVAGGSIVSFKMDSGFSSLLQEANAGRLGGGGGFRGGVSRGSFSGRSPSRSSAVSRAGSGFSRQGSFNRANRQFQNNSIRYSDKTRPRSIEGRPVDRPNRQEPRQEPRQEKRENVTERQENRLSDRNERLDNRRDNRENAREDWQDFRNRSREDRQDFIEDMYDDHGYWRHRGWHHHHHGGFFAGLVIGASIASLPTYTHTIVYSGTTYYYSAGVYYVSEPSGYVIVAPPTGILVEAPPADCEEVKVVDKTYCYNRGSFYSFDNNKNGYVVVSAPEGAMVSAIPEESQVKMVNGVKYHVYLGVYYRPHFYRNDYVYVVSKI